MGVYTAFKDGYAKETTFKDGTTIDSVDDTAYLWGAISQVSKHPSPVTSINYQATGYNAKEVVAGALWKNYFDLRGMYGIRMQNGILCWAAMGKSTTTTDNGAPYTHAIVGPYTDGSLLPSFVINHEEQGTATNEEYQFLGCKVDTLTLTHDLQDNLGLVAIVDWLAGKAQDGIVLDTDPALPATANTAPFVELERKWDSAGTPVSLDGLTHIEIVVANGLMPLYAHSYDTGTYTGRWPYAFAEATRKTYQIRMTLHQSTIERALWDELIATGNTKDATFKWVRGTNDYILVTASDCQVVDHPINTPEVNEPNLVDVVLEPRAIAIEVKDAIAGGAYGE